jgi:hypothetical protein
MRSEHYGQNGIHSGSSPELALAHSVPGLQEDNMNAYETALALTVMARAKQDGTVDSFVNLDGFEQDCLPKTGFYVGGVRPSLVVSDVSDLDRGDLAWFIGGTEARYFGVWTDTDDGKIYFDAVTHVDNFHDAFTLGSERGEIAIWDIERGEEIRVKADQGTETE